MYSETTQYVTKQDYFTFTGIDLDIEFKNSQTDNPGNAVKIFLQQQQDWLYTYMHRKFDISKWSEDWDDDVFSDALKWQIKHVLRYGEDDKLDNMAYQILRRNGLANHKVFGG